MMKIKVVTEADLRAQGFSEQEIQSINARVEEEYDLWTNGDLGKNPKYARRAPKELEDQVNSALRQSRQSGSSPDTPEE